VPDGDYEQLASLRPIVAKRWLLLVADAAGLVNGGSPLLPTPPHSRPPDWTVVLAAATVAQSSRVQRHFEGPNANPSYRARSRGRFTSDTDSDRYDLWYDATTVGVDLLVETWTSHSRVCKVPTVRCSFFLAITRDRVRRDQRQEANVRRLGV